MNNSMAKIASALVALVLLTPAFVAAHEDLRAAIELAVLSDPRSQSLSEAQVRELVDALHADADAQGTTAEDITWRPVPPQELQAGYAQCGMLCSLTNAFGFDGSNYVIPIMLGASALMLIFIFGATLGYRHFHHLHPKPAPSMEPTPMPSAPPIQ